MGRRGSDWISQLERLAVVLVMVAIALRLFLAALPHLVLPAVVFVSAFITVRIARHLMDRY